MHMLFGFLLTLYVINCILLVLVILIQQGKGGLGIGALGGNSQMLFGGSGGQDLFQKITWTLTVLYMAGSLGLSIMRTRQFQTASYTTDPYTSSAPATTPDLPNQDAQ